MIIKVQLPEKKFIETSAMVSANYAGLAIHRDVNIANPSAKTGWTITHVNSGLALKRNVRLRKQAVRIAIVASLFANFQASSKRDIMRTFKGATLKEYRALCFDIQNGREHLLRSDLYIDFNTVDSIGDNV